MGLTNQFPKGTSSETKRKKNIQFENHGITQKKSWVAQFNA